MSGIEMTHKQGQALARFIAELRPDWDAPGVEAALGKARTLAPPADLAVAAIKAAKDAKNRTPAIIALQGEHWRASEVAPRREQLTPDTRCSICSQSKDAHNQVWAFDHGFEPDFRPAVPAEAVTARVDQLRAELTTPSARPSSTPAPTQHDERTAP